MTVEQAMELLIQATASIQANRQTHAQIAEAIKIVQEALKKGNG